MVLQTTFDSGYKTFIDLGTEFHMVDKESCPDEFMRLAERNFGKNINEFVDKCFAFLSYGAPAWKEEPLYACHNLVILNDNGEVFKNLTLR